MNLSKKLKKVLLSVLSVFTFASAISVTSSTTTVNASGLDVRATVSAYINVSSTGAHYSFNGGNNFDVIMTGSKDQLSQVGLDCTAGAVAIAAHAISLAGGDPYEYLGMLNGVLNTVYPPSLRSYFESSSKWSTIATSPVDVSTLEPGDLLIYGTSGAGHMAIYAGGGEIFDFRSNGAGSNTYAGYANFSNYQQYMGTSSGSGSNALSGVYRANMSREISVNVKKTSSNTSVTNDNPNYSDLTAVFGVYTNASCTNKLGTITTDKDGNGSATYTVDGGTTTIYVKEEVAPVNYSISGDSVQSVDVSSGTGNVAFSDSPNQDPANIKLVKVDSEGKQVTANMAGAEFTFKYYAVNLENVNTVDDIANMTPTKTWVFKTVELNGSYYAGPNINGSFVEDKSDTIYEGSSFSIPYGVLTVEETEPVESYTTKGGFFKTGSIQMDANGTMFFKVNSPNSIENMISGNEITKKEDSIRGGYKIVKEDYSTGTTPEGDGSLAGAEFDLYYLGDLNGNAYGMKLDTDGDGLGDGTEYMPSETTPIDHVVIGGDGTYTSSSEYLGYGKYKLVETKAGDGYLTENYDGVQVSKEFTVSDDETIVEFSVENYPMLGSFAVQKNDEELQEAYAQGDANLQMEFEVVNASANPVTVLGKTYAVGDKIDIEGKGETTFTTDKNGFYKATERILPYGTYTIHEVKVPEGYTDVGTTSHTFSIREDGEVYSATFKIFNKPVRGGFEVQKNDKEYNKRNQGDTDLTTTFELYNRSTYDVLVDVNGDGILDKNTERFAPGKLITTFTTDEKGYYNTSKDYLPYGTYEIVESASPNGYTHNASETDGVLSKTFTVRDKDKLVDLTYEIFNRVYYGKFEVYKVAANSTSDWTEPEANVEFTAILSSKIGEGKEFATFEDAYKYINEHVNADGDVVADDDTIVFTKHEYAIITTGEDGKATSNDLAFGTYTIKQTSHVEDTQDVTNEATFEVTKDGQATISYTATNTPMKYRLHMVKVDADTKKTVTLNSAEFKIFQLTDRKGREVNEYVKQKVGLLTYDTFKTNSDNNGLVFVDTFNGIYTDHNDNGGSVTTPLQLEAGTYRIDEIKTPNGYLQLEEPIEFEVKESTITRHDDDGDAIIEVEVVNNKPHGELVIEKDIEDYDYDQSLLREGFDYSTIQFELRAAEDIIDPADGTVLTAKGEVANDVNGIAVGSITLVERIKTN